MRVHALGAALQCPAPRPVQLAWSQQPNEYAPHQQLRERVQVAGAQGRAQRPRRRAGVQPVGQRGGVGNRREQRGRVERVARAPPHVRQGLGVGRGRERRVERRARRQLRGAEGLAQAPAPLQ